MPFSFQSPVNGCFAPADLRDGIQRHFGCQMDSISHSVAETPRIPQAVALAGARVAVFSAELSRINHPLQTAAW
jgi:hypothetical protein